MSVAAPATCFWELNRRCGFGCVHCRAEAGPEGHAGPDPQEALSIADQLVNLGVGRVVLTGGEPLLHPAWAAVARRLASGGVRVRLFTSGDGLDPSTLSEALCAGVSEVSVSVDGPEGVHNRLRPRDSPGSAPFDTARAAVSLLLDQDVATRVVSQVNRWNVDQLHELYGLLVSWGVEHWQLHLCQATGRARADGGELGCAPDQLEGLMDVMRRAARERRLTAPLQCTVGYLTAEEPLLRGLGGNRRRVWEGCGAGRTSVAITPEGGVKGCTTLPDAFVTGTLVERSLAAIWQDDEAFAYTRKWSPEMLAGPCVRCEVAQQCRAGCPTIAYASTGAVGANPYCLRRVREQGRER